MKKISFSLIVITLLISFTPIVCLADYSNYVWSNTSDLTTLVSNNLTENYTDEELLEMGVSEDVVNNRSTIKLYNDVVLN